MDNIHLVKKTTLAAEKKSITLVLPYLDSISLQTRIKLKRSLKIIFNSCKLQIVFKSKTRLSDNFDFKDWIPKDLILVSFVSFSVSMCYCSE